ncbi:MAG: T9SS type A sorting domain-containing protein [Desulfobulbaceae bacterium]|nr:T9SS type A sorting domain-containing protein [Desulfobulbaceae bacterium]
MTKNFFILSSYMLLMLLPTINAQPIWEKVGFEIGDYKYIRCIDDLNCIGIKTHSYGNNKLIKTTDGGKNWFDLYVENYVYDNNGNIISFPDPREMNSISYVDENHIFVGRNKGCIFVSRDAGKSFDTVVIAEKIDNEFVSASRIFNLDMADSLNGAAISDPYICITDDGWKTFKRIKLDNIFVPEGFSYAIGGALFNNLKFWNKDCYMMSIVISKFNVNHFEYLLRGVIITKDGGKTWIYPDCIELFKSEFDTNHFSFFSIKFINSKIGWLVGYLEFDNNYDYGTVIKTYDGGMTWNLIYIDKTLPNYGLFDVDFKDELNGTAVGKFGHIIRTTDGGYSWFRDSFLNLSNDEENWRIVQKVTYAGEHVLLSTFGDGLWRGTYPASSVNESTEAGNGLSIFPNPATEYIEINATINPTVNRRVDEGSEIKIFNTLGECVMTVETIHELSLQRINVSHLPRGVYYLRIGSRTQMFVKV